VVALLLGGAGFGQRADVTAIEGAWGVDGRTLLELKADRAGAVTGTAYFRGNPPAVLPIMAGTFVAATRALTLAGNATVPGASAPLAWTIEGTLDGDSLSVTYTFGASKGAMLLQRLPTQAASNAGTAGAPGTVLVTGSSRGLGLEFVRQYAAAGWNVIATARDPGNAAELRALADANRRVVVETLDLLDRTSIAALAAKYRGRPIDVVLNNGGLLGEMKGQQLGALDYEEFERVMAVNVFGALAVAEAFQEHVAASREKKIVSLTSRSGIISLPGARGPYFYRASKAALNMTTRVLADDLRAKGIIVALVSPPPTDTDMLRALIGPEGAARQARPEVAVAGLVKVIASLTPEHSGAAPIYFDGSVLPW
jgi:NAD(P)-dependent dehydrogenase (short-subunit alcohol dehydrogenase family)